MLHVLKKTKKEFWLESEYRTVFQPKTIEAQTLKNEIKTGVENLLVENGELLSAEFSEKQSAKKGFYDIENVLFYNVGAKCFSKLVNHGLVFFKTDLPESASALYQYKYSVIEKPTLEYGQEIALLNDILFEGSWKGKKPDYFWKSLKKNGDKITVHKSLGEGKYALDLFVEKPEVERINLSTVMKPLLDGLICALHKGAFPLEKEAELCEKWKCDSSWIRNEEGVLWAREYYKGRAWNPADDECEAVSIRLENSKDGQWHLSGRILTK